MGAERIAPGKTNAIAYAQQSNRGKDEVAPGKRTLVEKTYGAQTAETVRRGENFLTETDRILLKAEYIGRVNDAHTAYLDALTQLEIEKTVQSEDEYNIVAALLFAAGGEAAKSVVKGVVSLLGHAGKAVEELTEIGIKASAKEAENKMSSLTEKSVEFLILQATDIAKTKIKSASARALGSERKSDKTTAINFIHWMKDASMTLFQHFREYPLSHATDAQLTALVVAFEGDRQTPSLYKGPASAHIELYLKSHARNVGHRETTGVEGGKQVSKRIETRTAWISDGKNPPRLGYVQQEYTESPGDPGSAYTTSEHAIGFEEPGTWRQHDANQGAIAPDKRDHDVRSQAPAAEPKFLGYVEDELADVATDTQSQRWLQGPETYLIHYPSMQLTKAGSK